MALITPGELTASMKEELGMNRKKREILHYLSKIFPVSHPGLLSRAGKPVPPNRFVSLARRADGRVDSPASVARDLGSSSGCVSRDREAVRRFTIVRRYVDEAPRTSAIRLYEASLMRHRYLWGHLHIAKHIEPRQMAAGTRETAEYSSR